MDFRIETLTADERIRLLYELANHCHVRTLASALLARLAVIQRKTADEGEARAADDARTVVEAAATIIDDPRRRIPCATRRYFVRQAYRFTLDARTLTNA